MAYVLLLLLGFLVGSVSVFAILESKRSKASETERRILDLQRTTSKKAERIAAAERELEELSARFAKERAEFDKKVISYDELGNENLILKHDLQNVDVNLRKLQLDHDLREEAQRSLDQRTNDLGSTYLAENIKWIGSSITPNNYANSKKRLQKVIESCRTIGFEISPDAEAEYLDDLKREYEKAVRRAFEREEQARIKAQIREEQKLEREIERELKQLDREREAIRVALTKALAETKDEHSVEIERLKARLNEAEEKSQRAMSRAQMTKSGHVYVISNIGSFGENVFKIGLTRRLEPMDRVKELGDASVPFPFDVHMMISSDDAPALENALHRNFHNLRLNKANPRKEFFRTDFEAIRHVVEQHHGHVDYVADPEALQYRQSIEMSDEDMALIESVYERLDDESETVNDD